MTRLLRFARNDSGCPRHCEEHSDEAISIGRRNPIEDRSLTAAVKQTVNIDLSNIATKTDLADLRREMADMKAELVKWVVGVGFAQVATILAVLKLFPVAHP